MRVCYGYVLLLCTASAAVSASVVVVIMNSLHFLLFFCLSRRIGAATRRSDVNEAKTVHVGRCTFLFLVSSFFREGYTCLS